jgi:hypothetical protein
MDLTDTENRRHFAIVCMADPLDGIALTDVGLPWITNE